MSSILLYALVIVGVLVALGCQAMAGADRTPHDYVVCSTTALKPFYGKHVPTRGEIVQRIGCSLARNEYEPVMVGVHASQSIRNVRIGVQSDLPVKTYRIYFNRREEPDRGELDIPWFLFPDDRIAQIDAGHTGTFWLVFHADGDTRAGKHHGSIRINVDGKPATVLDLVVRVRPITLPRPNIAFGMFYPSRFPGHLRGEVYERMYFEDMVAHGMTTCTVMPGQLAEFTENTERREGRILYDTWASGRMLQQMKQAGLAHPDIPTLLLDGRVNEVPDPTATADDLREQIRMHDWPELLLYMHDEPSWRQFEELTPYLTRWKKVPHIRNVTAMNSQPAYGLGYLHDVWIVRNDEITPELLKEAQRIGAEVWTYSIDLCFSNPLANRYYAGLYTWGFDLGGNHPWAYHDGPSSFLREDGTPNDFLALGYVLPSEDGPIPSVGWEGRREGVDDYRYLQLLETMLAAVPSDDATAKKARAWLAKLKGQIGWNFYLGNTVGDSRAMDFHNPTPHIDADEYSAIRDKAADYILKLEPVARKPLPPLTRKVPQPIVGKYEPADYIDKSIEACIEALSSSNVADRRSAARALTLRGPEAAPAVARLTELIEDEDVRFVAFRALDVIGPAAAPAIPTLAKQLEHDDPFVRVGATFALGGIGPKALPALEKSLNDEAWYVAVIALQKVGQMGPAAAPVVSTLVEQLDHPNGDRSNWAAAALRDIGPAAVKVMPVLIDAARSRSSNVRWWSAEALGKLGPTARDAVPVLEEAAKDDNDELMQIYARIALFQILGDEQHLVEVANMFPTRSDLARRRGAGLLKSLGVKASPIATQIRQFVESEKITSIRKDLASLLEELPSGQATELKSSHGLNTD